MPTVTSQPPRGAVTKRAVAVAKVVLMVLPIAWIYPRLDWSTVAERAMHFGVVGFMLAGAVLALTVVLNGCRWHELLRAHEASPLPPRASLIAQSFIALYLNQLPGGVAGDVVRAHRVRESVDGTVTSMAVLVLERVCGLVALLLLATIGALTMPAGSAAGIEAYLKVSAAATGVIALLGVGAPWVITRVGPVGTLVARVPVFGAMLGRVRVPTRLGPMFSALAQSFLIHALTLAVISMFVHTMAPGAPIRALVAIAPLAMLLTFVPLTPGGFGQREAVFVQLFGLAGVSASEAVAASLLWFSSASLSLVIGFVLAAIERVRASAPTS
jgi:glycosyltransferase 2 family protein